ncbi:DUF6569 family protein [Paraflavitalea sp. CAU 1676]|uniref:ARPP-1 family domain-containing protein n=1 Tax=Paraflavitalea sp. CAU 1676 TaxID=3032598 RepID=UPI0023DCAB71|nr:DUF6569 family protein [Paraflavitalea sp. CAU 1676]MDF2187305.1 hypothetical protein [Paraflavitalea sp. CAU 1676]
MFRIIFFIVLMAAAGTVSGQLTYNNLTVDYDSTWTYKNIKIIPIRPKGGGTGSPRGALQQPGRPLLSLSQALKRGHAKITERGTASTENVHYLRINNFTDTAIFIASGEVITGGRQDRMVTHDTIMVPNGRDQYFDVMCVEEGRWSNKEKAFGYYGYANPSLRKVVDASKNQVLVWKEIFGQLEGNAIKSPTLAYTARKQDKKYVLQEAEYFRYFFDKIMADSSITGIVCVSGDKVIGTDIFAGNNLFREELEPLLRGYIEQAIEKGSPAIATDAAIKQYMDKILTSEFEQEQYLKKNGKIFRFEQKVYHLTGYGE